MDINALMANYKPVDLGFGTPQQGQKKKKGFWLDQISTGTGILGGIAGTAVAPIAGTAAGAGLGSALGEAIENAMMGESLSKNVVKEGLIGGVMGAGPIKLAKGGAALAMGKGIQGASKAAMTPLRQKAGRAVLGMGDDLALKNHKINDSGWIQNFKKQIGEDPGEFARTRGFTGKSADEIAETIQRPLQDIYRQSISKISPIPKAEIENGLKAIYDPLLNNIAKDNQLLGQRIKAEADSVIGQLPKYVNPAKAYDTKITFDALVDQTLMDKSGKLANNVNKQVADVFRNAINKQADKSGVTFAGAIPISGIKAKTLKELGKELQGIDEFVEKAGIKSQVGRGKNIVGLTPAMAASGALASGNPLMAAPAVAGTMFANSKAGSSLISKGVTGAGNLLSKGGSNGQTPLGIAGRVVAGNQMFGGSGVAPEQADAQSLEDALMGVQSESASSVTNANSMNMPMATNMGQGYQNPLSLSSGEIFPNETPWLENGTSGPLDPTTKQPIGSSPYSKENLLADMQRDPANANKYIAYYQELDEIFNPMSMTNLKAMEQMQGLQGGGAQKPLSQNQQQRSDLIKAIDLTDSAMSQGSINYGPIGSRVESAKSIFNRGDTETTNFKSIVGGLRGAIAIARAGASMSEGERKLLDQYTPNFTDSEQQLRSKLAGLKSIYGGSQPMGGGGSLEDVLMQYQTQGSLY